MVLIELLEAEITAMYGETVNRAEAHGTKTEEQKIGTSLLHERPSYPGSDCREAKKPKCQTFTVGVISEPYDGPSSPDKQVALQKDQKALFLVCQAALLARRWKNQISELLSTSALVILVSMQKDQRKVDQRSLRYIRQAYSLCQASVLRQTSVVVNV